MGRITKRAAPPTAEVVRSLFDYDPETGKFTRLVRSANQPVGSEPGFVTPWGYRNICVESHGWYAQRLVWLWMTGEWPDGEVDHIDGDRLNNRFGNLRVGTREQNAANMRGRPRGKSGYRGVSENTCGPAPWKASISYRGKTLYLGKFFDPAEAHAAYVAKKRELHGEFAHIDQPNGE